MNIAVTGGAGFIGSNYILYHMKEHPEDQIHCVDKLTYAGNLSNLSTVRRNLNFKFHKIDICDKQQICHFLDDNNIDLVINFAAESHVDNSITNPGVFVDTNVVGTESLLEGCKMCGNIRFHQVSTDEVYGDLPLDRPDLQFAESAPINPSSPYSASKASADLLVQAYFRTFNSSVTISRCSNNYGPYQFPEKLIPLMITKCLNNESLPVYGDGLNVRDWLYVEDHCRAIDLIIRNGKLGEVYNIGGHNELSNIDVVKTILKVLHRPESLIEYVEDRKGHDRRYAIDPRKIEDELGWRPITKFEDGIRQTMDWYLAHRGWWGDILTGLYRYLQMED